RLMRQCGEDEKRGAYDHGKDAEIEEGGAGQMDFADEGEGRVRGVRGEEGVAEGDGPEARTGSQQEAGGEPAYGAEVRVVLDPNGSRSDVLHEERDGHDQTGHEAAARLVVTTQE